jgi:hypothetical protein
MKENKKEIAYQPDEQARLEELTRRILNKENTFYDVGKALREIQETGIYRNAFSTFEQYCREKFDLNRRHAYRKIDCAKVIDNLKEMCPNGTQFPKNERQTRPLTKLEPKNQVLAWKMAFYLSETGMPKARDVSKAVVSLNGEKKKETDPSLLEKKSEEFRKAWTALHNVILKERHEGWAETSPEAIIHQLKAMVDFLRHEKTTD